MLLAMPMLLKPEHVRFEMHDSAPVLRLLVDQPTEASTDGWSLMNRVTLCVVDGPGDTGYLFPRLGLDVPAGWDEAAQSHGGAFVVFGSAAEKDVFAHAV